MKFIYILILLVIIPKFSFSQVGPVYNFNFYNPDNTTLKQQPSSTSETKEDVNKVENESGKAEENKIIKEEESKGVLSYLLDNFKNRTWIGLSHSKDKSNLNDGSSRIALYLPFGGSGYYIAPLYQSGKVTRIETLHYWIDQPNGVSSTTRGFGVGLYKIQDINKWFSVRWGGSYSKEYDIAWSGESVHYEDLSFVLKTFDAELSPCFNYKNFMLAGVLKLSNQHVEFVDHVYKKTSMFYGLELGIRI
jgi:hypothetical protein